MEAAARSNIHVIANPEVWMETAALDQLRRVSRFEGCRRAVGMPDLHPGRGIPIGAAFAFDGIIRPELVGGDAGCGALVVFVRRAKHQGDALLRRVRAETEGPVLSDCDPEALFDAAWRLGPSGLLGLEWVPRALQELAESLDLGADDLPASSARPADDGYGEQLGTAGGGNHFAEIAQVHRVVDYTLAAELGVAGSPLAVVAHSGSRRLGTTIASRWHDQQLESPEAQGAYLADLAGCCRYARTNRLLLAWRLLSALGSTRPTTVGRAFDVIHNAVSVEVVDGAPSFVHRKGCTPAGCGQPTIVLGSRGTPSWVMVGQGNAESLASVAHGAGRRMTRSEAISKLRDRYPRVSLTRTSSGGTVLCDDAELLYAEHPDAYKPIEPIIDSLEQAGAARRVAALLPIVNVKR